ncbi:hypothetical protein PSPO01_15903 [Paraphaeosphaeria sporulosa]
MLRSSAPSELLKAMPFSPRARRCGTSQTLLVSDGLTRKPISSCILYVVTALKRCLGSVVALVLLRSMDVSYCVACSRILSVCPCRGRNGDPTGAKSTRRDA